MAPHESPAEEIERLGGLKVIEEAQSMARHTHAPCPACLRTFEALEQAEARVKELEKAVDGYETVLHTIAEWGDGFHDDILNLMSTMPVFAPWLKDAELRGED